MSNYNIKPRWKPGKAPYAEWLKQLTPEEYQNHLAERRARKSIKKSQEILIEHNRITWLTKFNASLAKAMVQAEITGNVDALIKIAKLLDIAPVDKIETTLEATVTAVEVGFKDTNVNS